MVKAPIFHCRERTKYTPDKRGFEFGQILITIKVHRGGMVLKLRPLVTVAGIDQIKKGVRMAEWLRPGLQKVLTIKLRGIEPGQILITKSPQGRDGTKVTSLCNCGWHIPQF